MHELVETLVEQETLSGVALEALLSAVVPYEGELMFRNSEQASVSRHVPTGPEGCSGNEVKTRGTARLTRTPGRLRRSRPSCRPPGPAVPVCPCVILIEVDGLEPKDVTPETTPFLWELAHPCEGQQIDETARAGWTWQAPRVGRCRPAQRRTRRRC